MWDNEALGASWQEERISVVERNRSDRARNMKASSLRSSDSKEKRLDELPRLSPGLCPGRHDLEVAAVGDDVVNDVLTARSGSFRVGVPVGRRDRVVIIAGHEQLRNTGGHQGGR